MLGASREMVTRIMGDIIVEGSTEVGRSTSGSIRCDRILTVYDADLGGGLGGLTRPKTYEGAVRARHTDVRRERT